MYSRGIERRGAGYDKEGGAGDKIVEPSVQRWPLTLWERKRWGMGRNEN